MLIVSYALSGFAHLASVGIFVGGTIALIPSRRKDISELGWKALFAGTLATLMIAAVSGVYYMPGNASILGEKQAPVPVISPSPVASPPAATQPPLAVPQSPAPISAPAIAPKGSAAPAATANPQQVPQPAPKPSAN